MAERRSRPTTKRSGRTRHTEAQQTERLNQAHHLLVESVQQLATGEDWMKVLQMSRRLPNYSVNNCLLLAVQGAQGIVMGYQAWRKVPATGGRFCQVRSGAQGLKILAPVTRTLTEVDEVTGEESTVARRVGFKLVTVFDEASLICPPDFPEPPHPQLLDGEAPEQLWDALAAQVSALGFRLDTSTGVLDALPETNGITDFEVRTVAIRPDLSPAQRTKTLAHELAHVLLHRPDVRPAGLRKSLAEVEAESVAFLVTSGLGFDSSQYSVPYVTGWARGDANLVLTTADRVVKTARRVVEVASLYLDGAGIEAAARSSLELSTPATDDAATPAATGSDEDLSRLYDRSRQVIPDELASPVGTTDAHAAATEAANRARTQSPAVSRADQDAVMITTPSGAWQITWHPEYGTYTASHLTEEPVGDIADHTRHVSRVIGALHQRIDSLGALEQDLGFALPRFAREHLAALQADRPAPLTGGRDFSGLYPGEQNRADPPSTAERPSATDLVATLANGQPVAQAPYAPGLAASGPLRRWSRGGFTVEILDNEQLLEDEFAGLQALTYRLTHHGQVIFSGDDILAPADIDPTSDVAIHQIVRLLTQPDDDIPFNAVQTAFLNEHAPALSALIQLAQPPYPPGTRVAIPSRTDGHPPITGTVVQANQDAHATVSSYSWRPDMVELPGHPWQDNPGLTLVSPAGDVSATLAEPDVGLRDWTPDVPLAFGAAVTFTLDDETPALASIARAYPTTHGWEYDIYPHLANPATDHTQSLTPSTTIRMDITDLQPVTGTAWPSTQAILDARQRLNIPLQPGEVLAVGGQFWQAVDQDGGLALIDHTPSELIPDTPPAPSSPSTVSEMPSAEQVPTKAEHSPCASTECYSEADALVSVGWPAGPREITERCTPCAAKIAVTRLPQGCAVDIRPLDSALAQPPATVPELQTPAQSALPGAAV